MKFRLADIAAQAGVSEATVSRVLNNKPMVSQATRQSVLTALDVLGFERPAGLRRTSSGLVGLIVPELTNPVFPQLAQVIEDALSGESYTAVLCTQTPGGVHEDEYTQMLLDRGAAGIIFVSGLHADASSDIDRYTRLVEVGLPMVLLNGSNPALPLIPQVSDDDIFAMRIAVDYLAGLGHTRIGLALGQPRYRPVIRKSEGFTAAIGAHPGVTGTVEHTRFSVDGGHLAATRLIRQGCTALICGSDIMALGAIAAAASSGLRVPQDVSVIGYDDSPLMGFTAPPLTTLHQNIPAIGEAAVHSLLTQIRGEQVPTGEQLFRSRLVVRSSTGPAPV